MHRTLKAATVCLKNELVGLDEFDNDDEEYA